MLRDNIIRGADGADGIPGQDGSDGIYTRCDQHILEMQLEFKTSYLCHYKTFTYNVDKQLTDIDIWADSTASVKLFHKDLTYDVDKNLIQTDLTRISDAVILTSIFTYDVDKQLISIDRSGYCVCSSSSSSSSVSSSSLSSSSAMPWNCAVSYTLNVGDYLSGEISDTFLEDSTSLCINEVVSTPGSRIIYDFENIPVYLDDSTSVIHLYWSYSYEGNPPHNIIAEVWNYNLAQWDEVTISTSDFPDTSGSYVEVIFNIGSYPGLNLQDVTPYLENGNMRWRQTHTSPGNINHIICANWLYLDVGYQS